MRWLPPVRNKQIAGGVDGNAARVGKCGTGGGDVVAVVGSRADAGDRRDDPGGYRHFANATGIREVKISGGIDRDAIGNIHYCGSCVSAIPNTTTRDSFNVLRTNGDSGHAKQQQ
jgi:hypothetical protein